MDKLTAADLEVVLATDLRRYAKDTRALRALLTDAAAALRVAEADKDQLHRDVERIKSARRAAATPLAAAIDAVSELSYPERQQILSIQAQELIDVLNRELAEVRARQIAVASAARMLAAVETDLVKAAQLEQLAQLGAVEGSEYIIDFDPFTVTTVADALDDIYVADDANLASGHQHQVGDLHVPAAWPGESDTAAPASTQAGERGGEQLGEQLGEESWGWLEEWQTPERNHGEADEPTQVQGS